MVYTGNEGIYRYMHNTPALVLNCIGNANCYFYLLIFHRRMGFFKQTCWFLYGFKLGLKQVKHAFVMTHVISVHVVINFLIIDMGKHKLLQFVLLSSHQKGYIVGKSFRYYSKIMPT